MLGHANKKLAPFHKWVLMISIELLDWEDEISRLIGTSCLPLTLYVMPLSIYVYCKLSIG